ncbi:Heterokaryon incompatibility [Penicillium tannophilum]|nr:Heterokaryon incompatibility [Penicillium tannophilum]
MSLYEGPGAFINGLPVVEFDRALLWYPELVKMLSNVTKLRRNITNVVVVISHGPVQYSSLPSSGFLWNISPLVAPALNGDLDSGLDDDWQVYMAIAIKEGCVRSVSRAFSLETDTLPSISELFNITE